VALVAERQGLNRGARKGGGGGPAWRGGDFRSPRKPAGPDNRQPRTPGESPAAAPKTKGQVKPCV